MVFGEPGLDEVEVLVVEEVLVLGGGGGGGRWVEILASNSLSLIPRSPRLGGGGGSGLSFGLGGGGGGNEEVDVVVVDDDCIEEGLGGIEGCEDFRRTFGLDCFVDGGTAR